MRAPARVMLVVSIAAVAGVFQWYTRAIQPTVLRPVEPAPAWSATGRFEHERLADILRPFVVADGRVDYARFAADAAARRALDAYLAAMAAVSPRRHADRFPTQADRLSYCLRAWTALGTRLVVDHWPLAAVQDITAPLEAVSGQGFFRRHAASFGGEPMTLHGIVNEWLFPEANDPRIVFALGGFAAMWGPTVIDLPAADGWDAFLDHRAAAFVNDPERVVVDTAAHEIKVGSLAMGYRDYLLRFVAPGPTDDQRLVLLLARFGSQPRKDALTAAVRAGWRISPLPADWALR